MLDRDLAQLAAGGVEPRLAGLEVAIWSRVEALNHLQRLVRVTFRVQLLASIFGLVASTAVGVLIVSPPGARRDVMQISAAAADIAPSTLLGAPR